MNSHNNQIVDENNYTPEALAWKLLMDDNITISNLMVFSDVNNKETVFEVLLTIYFEMIFGHYKLMYLEANCHQENYNENYDDIYDNFKLDITQVNLFKLTDIFASKFNKLNFILNAREITRDEYNISKNNRYCTILLKDSPFDEAYFLINKQFLDPEKRYHFVLNCFYKKIENINLREIYCTIIINSVCYKIYFTNIN